MIFRLPGKPEQVGHFPVQRKELLRAALLSVTFKLYLDTTFRFAAGNDARLPYAECGGCKM